MFVTLEVDQRCGEGMEDGEARIDCVDISRM